MNSPHSSTDRRGRLDRTPDSLPPQLRPEVEIMLKRVLEEARDRGEGHVNALLGARSDNHPTRLILEELIERLQEELGYGPVQS